jgi:hypothetical protein
MRTRFLLGVLVGVLLTVSTLAARDTYNYIHALENRVRYIEGYLGVLDQFLKSGGLTIEPQSQVTGAHKVKA